MLPRVTNIPLAVDYAYRIFNVKVNDSVKIASCT